MGSTSKLLAKSSALRTSLFVANIVVAFLMMPFIIHSLGDRMYGLWVVVGSVLGYYWLVDFGISAAVERGISRSIGRKEEDEANIVINTGLFLYSICGLIILVLSFIIASALPHFITKIDDIVVFRKVFIIMGLSFAFNFPMRVFSGILRAHLRYDLMSIAGYIVLVVRTLLILLFLKLGYGVVALAGITFFADIVNRITMLIMAKKVFSDLVFSRKLIRFNKIKNLIEYSSFAFISQIADQMRFNIDNIVIAAVLGLNQVTLYSIASRLIMYFRRFMMSAMGMMMPLFSQYEGQDNFNAIREKFMFLTKVNGYISVFIGGIMIIFGQAFINRWMGPEYSSAYEILFVLTAAMMFTLMQRTILEVLQGISKHQYSAIVDICEAIANVVLSIILIKKLGLIGVAYGTAIPLVIKLTFFLPPYVCSTLGIKLRKYFLEAIGGVILRSSIIILIPFYFYKYYIQPNYLNMLLMVSFQGIIFTVFIYLFGFDRHENQLIRGILRGTKIAKFIPKALLA